MKTRLRKAAIGLRDATETFRPVFMRDASGASAVEFAFILPIIGYLFIGVVEFGVGTYRKMEVQDAAQVGAQYAVIHGFDSAAIAQAVVNASIFPGVAASPVPASYCGCASNAGVVQAACGSTCSDGTAAGTYVSVNASGQYSAIFRYPGLSNSFALTGKATVRLQ
jgi:Flp pilus assembly protein TadG